MKFEKLINGGSKYAAEGRGGGGPQKSRKNKHQVSPPFILNPRISKMKNKILQTWLGAVAKSI